jgi:aspartate oxidase
MKITLASLSLLVCFVFASFAAETPTTTPTPVPAKPAALKSVPVPELELVKLENLALKSQLSASQEQVAKLQAIVSQQATEENKQQQDKLKSSQQEIASKLCKSQGLSFEGGTCSINFQISKEHPVPTVEEVVPQPSVAKAEAKK